MDFLRKIFTLCIQSIGGGGTIHPSTEPVTGLKQCIGSAVFDVLRPSVSSWRVGAYVVSNVSTTAFCWLCYMGVTYDASDENGIKQYTWQSHNHTHLHTLLEAISDLNIQPQIVVPPREHGGML